MTGRCGAVRCRAVRCGCQAYGDGALASEFAMPVSSQRSDAPVRAGVRRAG